MLGLVRGEDACKSICDDKVQTFDKKILSNSYKPNARFVCDI